MENSTINKNNDFVEQIIKKNGINYGIVTGVIGSLLTAVVYAIDIEWFASYYLSAIKFVFYTTIGIILLVQTKKAVGGVIDFKNTFKTYFISAVIGVTIISLFEYVLFNFIDPSAADALKEIMLKNTLAIFESMNTPKDVVSKAISDLKNTEMYSIGKMIQGTVMFYVLFAIYGLILAAFFKNNPKQSQF